MSTVEKCHNCADLRAKLQAAESALTHERAISADLRRDRDAAMGLGAAAEERAIKAEEALAKATAELDEATVALRHVKRDLRTLAAQRDAYERALTDARAEQERVIRDGGARVGRLEEALAKVTGEWDEARKALTTETVRAEIHADDSKALQRALEESDKARDSARRELEAEKRRADEAVRHAETSDAMMRKARADEAQARQLIEAQTARAHESERRAVGLAGLVARAHAHLDALYSQRPTWLAEDVAAFEALRDGGVAR
jgi:chromosome segregation ATPase